MFLIVFIVVVVVMFDFARKKRISEMLRRWKVGYMNLSLSLDVYVVVVFTVVVVMFDFVCERKWRHEGRKEEGG